MALDASGNIYFCDRGNNVVRKITTDGVITTVAGNGSVLYNGDNISATSASLFVPEGVAVDVNGDIYIADELHARIRKVTASTGIITTIAGTGTFSYAGDAVFLPPQLNCSVLLQ